MSYRLNGTDPFLKFAPGAFDGYQFRGLPHSTAMLLKRIGVSSWQGLFVIEDSGSNFSYPMEFNPSNQLASDMTGANPFSSTATFNNTSSWMIVGYTWDGTSNASGMTWRWKIGTNAYSSEADTSPGASGASPSAAKLIVGNIAGFGDAANYDWVCGGCVQSVLSQSEFESLNMTSFQSWKDVFITGGGDCWLAGAETISTLVDRTGNGGDEDSRSASVTLQSDPAGWDWASGGGPVFVRKRPVVVTRQAVQRAVLR